MIDPLRRNRFTGRWSPPLDGGHIINSVSRNQGTDNVAVFADDSTGQFRPIVFSSNVAANTFGPVATISDQDFSSGLPAFDYNSATNQAVLGAPKLGNPFLPGRIATVDLATVSLLSLPVSGWATSTGSRSIPSPAQPAP